MTAFYNEIDPYAAAWLRNLIAADHIAPGIVDERPIQEIEPYELVGFTQCHFFAGIGVWSHALRRAGWSDDRPVWTGSCPCQPFSNAGQKKGFQDDRHLWPYWKNLIDQCKPSVVIGEQVASALDWVDLVQADLEKSGYAFGANDLCAAGFGGAHIRQRIYFVGISDAVPAGRPKRWAGPRDGQASSSSSSSSNLRLADDDDAGPQRYRKPGQFDGPGRRQNSSRYGAADSTFGGMADSDARRRGRLPYSEGFDDNRQKTGRRENDSCVEHGGPLHRAGSTDAPLLGREAVDWLFCRDGKWRPVEPGTFPLVDETPSRVGRLRAYGNALDAETATEFCIAAREIADETGV